MKEGGTVLEVVQADLTSSSAAENALRELVHDTVAANKPLPNNVEYGVIQVKRVGMIPKAEVKTSVTF